MGQHNQKQPSGGSEHHETATTVALIGVLAAALHGIGGQFVPAQPKAEIPPPQIIVVVNTGDDNRRTYSTVPSHALPDGEPPRVLSDVYSANLQFRDDHFTADLHLSWHQAAQLSERFAKERLVLTAPVDPAEIMIEYQPLGQSAVDVPVSKNDLLQFLAESWSMTPALQTKLGSLEKIVIAQKKTDLKPPPTLALPSKDDGN